MRSLLLASAAVMLLSGAAMAQTTPAPTVNDGTPGAATAVPGMAPGKLNSTPGNGTNPLAGIATGGTTTQGTANDGAPNGPQATPGMSPGKLATAPSSTVANGSMLMGAGQHHHHMMMMGPMGGMPDDADAQTYLHMASMAIMHHNRSMADEALNRAETRLLTRAVPAGTMAPDSSPAISSIEKARMALSAGNYKKAEMDTHDAMHM